MFSASPSCRSKALAPFVALLLITSLPSIAVADPGDLLTSFGTGGIAFEGLGQNHQVKDAILHPTLGLLIATFESQGSFQAKLRLVQMDAETGVVLDTITYPQILDEQRELHLEDDGQGGVIVGASVPVSANDVDVLIYRLTPGLVIDAGFGLRQVPFNLDPANGYDELQDLEVLSDGRIVALVEVPTTGDFEAGLVFLNSDGSFDTTISNGGLPDGIAFVPLLVPGDVFPVALEEDSLGRLWVAAHTYSSGDAKVAVARMLPDATADTTFAGDGTTLVVYRDCVLCPAENADLEDLTVLEDRAYVAVTTRDDTDTYNVIAITRLNELGGTDSLFGIWRPVEFPAPAGEFVDAGRADLEGDPVRNRVVLATAAYNSSDNGYYAGIARLGLDGEHDPGFGGGAPVLLGFGAGSAFYDTQVAIQGVNDLTGTFSSLRIAVTEDVTQDLAVMAVEGFVNSIFTDDFESGDLSAWSVVSP